MGDSLWRDPHQLAWWVNELSGQRDRPRHPFPASRRKAARGGKRGGRVPRLAAKLSLPPGKLVGGAENGTDKHPAEKGGGRVPRLAAKLSLPPGSRPKGDGLPTGSSGAKRNGNLVGGAENGTDKHPGNSGRTQKRRNRWNKDESLRNMKTTR
jgi:hypothetical protein